MAAMTKSESQQWDTFFDRVRVFDSDFSRANFPLKDDPGDKAEEFGFDCLITGQEALDEFTRLGREPASFWAIGRYVQENRKAHLAHRLLGIGSISTDRYGRDCFPVFYHGRYDICVRVHLLTTKFSPDDDRFLVRKKA